MSPSGSAIELADELDGVGVKGSAQNLTDLEALVDAAVSSFGHIDAVVNHTGHPPKGDLLDITDEGWALGNERWC
ncbi:enoyl-ACP reductase-like protein [Phyllobacterium leguminum]|uniref:Enoyl-ACP reductase-like protein n=1 Tax=Phyllobacterium leguminum TaxID=314237 RepID=A0A318T672_9HYPH|nr:enoyl-ACP reductase-like protein [Phyllobacterium leguminum]